MPETLRIVALAAFLLATCVGCSERKSVAPISEDPPVAAPEALDVGSDADVLPSSDTAPADNATTVGPASEA